MKRALVAMAVLAATLTTVTPSDAGGPPPWAGGPPPWAGGPGHGAGKPGPGADAEAALVRCADVTYPVTLTGCGTDPLVRGEIEVKKNGDLDAEVSGALPNTAYDIVLHSLDGANQSAIAVLTTDAAGGGRVRWASAFDFQQAGVVAFSLGRNGSVEFVAGFRGEEEFEAGLIPCGAINLPAVQAGCGTDSLRSGAVKIEEGDLRVELSGGTDATYDVVFRPLGGGTDVPLGTLTTNRGRGYLRLEGFVPEDTVGAGNVVLRRDALDQFVTGFQSTRRRAPRVAKLHAGLVRCSEVNTLAPLAECGIDQLNKGQVMIDEKGDVKVHLYGAAPGAAYEVVFVAFDASTEVSLGTLTTNPAGNGQVHLRDAFPVGAVATGNVVIKREGIDQYVTGFVVVR
jgi:hypothetical protein